ncbi:hypothetical protein BDQ17DRAFT_1338839 [Cyathus striatus]|nr:hypothetical protein BDQ17DRAFT_1338839 [Cyathus striatus]
MKFQFSTLMTTIAYSEAIVKGLLKTFFEDWDFPYNAFCMLYKFDESAYILFDSAIPLKSVFNFHVNHRIPPKKLSDYDMEEMEMDDILLQEILESSLRAGDYFLNDIKSEQIFRGAWDYITEIKPSLYFKTFLQESAQDFDYCFSILCYEDIIEVVKDEIQSLMKAIDKFLKDCEMIENEKVSENEHYYTHQITHFGTHKFKNELDASYEMAIKHFQNSENDQMSLW